MSSGRGAIAEPFLDPRSYNTRTRSTSTVSRASSSHSGTSQDSSDSLERAKPPSVPQSPKPHHKKSGSFSKLFGTKEPSLNSFKHLAELQQKELAQKGQKIPFGVPQAKLPSSVKDDYKKAKQRAKERAKLHEAVKEKLKLHDDEDTQQHRRRSFAGSITIDDRHRSSSTLSVPHIPKSPRSPSKRFSALEPLPEVAQVDAASESPRSHAYPRSSPTAYDFNKGTLVQVSGVLSGDARKDALPWE